MSTRSRAKVPPSVAVDVQADIDDAIRRRDLGSLRNFADEARASGLDQLAARAYEVLSLLETKAAAAGRDELLRLKSALEPPEPTQAQLAAAFDRLTLGLIGGGSSEAAERQRAVNANAQLAARNRKIEEQRRRQVDEEPERPWWR